MVNRQEVEFQEALQRMESSILAVWKADPKTIDVDVTDALKVALRRYRGEEEGQSPREPSLADRPQKIYTGLVQACEQCLGRQEPSLSHPLTVAQVSGCLRRLIKSVDLWTKEAGRDGYLSYISQFL